LKKHLNITWWVKLEKTLKYDKSNFRYIQGVFENKHSNDLNVLESNEEFKSSLARIEYDLIQALKDKKLKDTIPLLEPLTLEHSTIYGYKIVELITKAQLVDEGNFQMHCVGGYKPTPKCRIFSVRWENSEGEFRHTMEVNTQKVLQSQGKRRRAVAEYPEKDAKMLQHIENYLLQAMNQVHTEKIKNIPEEDLMLDSLFDD